MTNEGYVEFLDTPIAELEQYDVPTRTIGSIEKKFGIYVRDLIGVTPDEITRKCRSVGEKGLQAIQFGLRCLLEDINSDG